MKIELRNKLWKQITHDEYMEILRKDGIFAEVGKFEDKSRHGIELTYFKLLKSEEAGA